MSKEKYEIESVTMYQITRRHIAEECNLHGYLRKNLKSGTVERLFTVV
jgi:hypothetical protein